MTSAAHRAPLATPALALLSGILLAPWLPALLAPALLGASALTWRFAPQRRSLAVGIALAALGLLRAGAPPPAPPSPGRRRLVVELRDSLRAPHAMIRHGPAALPSGALVWLSLEGPARAELRAGDLLELDAQVVTEGRRWPAIRGRWESARLLRRDPGEAPRAWLRARLDAALEGADPRLAALVAGLSLGDRRRLSGPLRELFVATGTAHWLAVSGLHVGLVAAGALWLLGLLPLPDRDRAALALLAVWVFAAVVGPRPSVLRAALAASVVLGGRWLGRRGTPWNSLAAAAILILLIEPGAAREAGCQLSFACVAALLLTPLRRPRRWRDRLSNAFRLAGAAALASAPLTLCHFGELAPAAALINPLIAPLLMLVTAGALITALCATVSAALAQLPLALTGLATTPALWALERAATLAPPLTERTLPPIGAAALLLSLGGLALRRRLALTPALAWLLWTGFQFGPQLALGGAPPPRLLLTREAITLPAGLTVTPARRGPGWRLYELGDRALLVVDEEATPRDLAAASLRADALAARPPRRGGRAWLREVSAAAPAPLRLALTERGSRAPPGWLVGSRARLSAEAGLLLELGD